VSASSLKQLDVMIPELRRQKSMQPGIISEDLQRSLLIVEWAAHIYITYVSARISWSPADWGVIRGFGIGYLSPPTTPKPISEAPYAGEVWKSRSLSWTPYPLLRAPIQLPLHSLYNQVCELYKIAPDAQALAFRDFAIMTPAAKLDAAQKMDARYVDWYRALPSRFQFGAPGFVLVPATIDLAYASRIVIVWPWLTWMTV
jgi:hypothetical protein